MSSLIIYRAGRQLLDVTWEFLCPVVVVLATLTGSPTTSIIRFLSPNLTINSFSISKLDYFFHQNSRHLIFCKMASASSRISHSLDLASTPGSPTLLSFSQVLSPPRLPAKGFTFALFFVSPLESKTRFSITHQYPLRPPHPHPLVPPPMPARRRCWGQHPRSARHHP
jgi:hypothetical protein